MIYDFLPLKDTQFNEPPEDGIYVYGLFLDGARFNMKNMKLDESQPKVLFEPVPHVSFFFFFFLLYINSTDK